MFLSLDFVYVPTADVDATADRYVESMGAELVWKVRGMGTVVACLRVAGGDRRSSSPVTSGARTPFSCGGWPTTPETVADLRAGGVTDIDELEIPHGPCASFRAPGGQRMAVYQLVRPGADAHFTGRMDG